MQKTESIAWGREAYEILENPPSMPELCVKVPPVKPKVGKVFLFSTQAANLMIAIGSAYMHGL